MKIISIFVLATLVITMTSFAQSVKNETPYEIVKINSHIPGLMLGLLHEPPATPAGRVPVLFIHGASFPSSLACGFRMSGVSWIDDLAEHNYDVYALDFLGYGYSDRYPNIPIDPNKNAPPGRAREIYKDIDSAVSYILKRTGGRVINIIAHSWGCTVAELYATKFPDKVQNLVLFAPFTPGKSQDPAAVIDHSYDSITPEKRVTGMRNLTPPDETCRLEPELVGKWQKGWAESDPAVTSDGKVHFPSGWEADIDDMDHGKLYFDPSLIKASTLIIRGEWDTTPTNDEANALFGQLKNATTKRSVTIEKATHVMHLEKSRWQLYQEALGFLDASPTMTVSKSIAVIFEVVPQEGKKQDYLDLAAQLRPDLAKIDGFISIERFQSLTHPEKILSLSYWRDEKAIGQWRNLELHREAQAKGREYIFKDYHLRIADVVRDYGMFDRKEAPADSREYHH